MNSTYQLYASLALAAYFAPCAWQDWRTRKVSNWLTVPAFVAAWPLAIWLGNFEWTVAVFVGCYVAWQFKGMGAADGKLATLMAAISPITLVVSTGFLAIGFLINRMRKVRTKSFPASVFLFMSTLCIATYGLLLIIGLLKNMEKREVES